MKQLLLKNMELFDDISILKKKINRLEKAENTILQAILDNLPFGIALINEDGNFTYINPKFKEMFGYDLKDIPDGRTWFRKAYPDDFYRHNVIATWKKDLEMFKKNRVAGERKSWTFTVTCKNGDKKIINFIPVLLTTGKHLLTCEDITEKTNLEAQLRQAQKAEAIGTLAGGIAHDFNNILTALMGYATLLKNKMDKQDPLQRYIELILSASQKAADLTRGLLAFSRKQPLNLTPLNVNSAIKETKKLLKGLLTEDIEFSVSFTKDEAVVMADRSQIDQILFNLVTNAKDAMPKGGALSIKTCITLLDNNFLEKHGFDKQGRYVLISVSDTGIGMDEETKEKIFDPFFTTKEIGKGTGLGLATVYAIVKKHNG
ncbi:MAG TPA: ATP-binding protein, partial [Syntrophorhabdaceae bacterium]|nr:ATP-binding protein [Syntrophorhabdaceae bacterium]